MHDSKTFLGAKLEGANKETWSQTHHGAVINLLDPDPRTIGFLDISRHLSRIVRYAGGGDPAITVAEHCVLGSRMVTDAIALEFLMHDAHEYIIGDITRPVVVAVQCICLEHGMHADPVAILKNRMQAAVNKKWNLKSGGWVDSAINEADLRMLQTERLQVMGPLPQPWSLPDSVLPYDLAIEGWSPEQAELEFRSAFIELATRRGIRLTGELSL
jgi:hypothetical protein